jgi:hypothetical protein
MPRQDQPNNSSNHNIDMNTTNIHPQTHNHKYGMHPKLPPTMSYATQLPVSTPMMIPLPSGYPNPRVPKVPLWPIAHNQHAQETHSHNIVDDLAQSPTTMFILEVLQTYPSQLKSMLLALGVVKPFNSCFITFDLDNSEPHLPSLVSFEILVTIWNITIHMCIINEGASTCIMYKRIWQKLGSLELPLLLSHFMHMMATHTKPKEFFKMSP